MKMTLVVVAQVSAFALLLGVAEAQETTLKTGLSDRELRIAAEEFAQELRIQAAQGKATASELDCDRAASGEWLGKLENAQKLGVGGAWYSQNFAKELKINGAPASDSVRCKAAAGLMTSQSADLAIFAAKIDGAAKSSTGNFRDAIEAIRPPKAVAVALGGSDIVDSPSGPGASWLNALPLINGYGALTADYPSVGAVIMDVGGASPTDPTIERVACTGTLISPLVVLTAGHCINNRYPITAVFFAGVGKVGVKDSWRSQDFYIDSRDAPHADVALLKLNGPITTIQPSPMQTKRVSSGTVGWIVGYGKRNALDPNGVLKAGTPIEEGGLKIYGNVTTEQCAGSPSAISAENVCWRFAGQFAASTCPGDSGGPLFVKEGSGWVVAGITSFGDGGTPANPCPPGSFAVDAEVHPFLKAISDQKQLMDPNPSPARPGALESIVNAPGRIGGANYFPMDGQAGTIVKRRLTTKVSGPWLGLSVNGAQADVRLKAAAPSGATFCDEASSIGVAGCFVERPEAGDWSIEVAAPAGLIVQVIAVHG